MLILLKQLNDYKCCGRMSHLLWVYNTANKLSGIITEIETENVVINWYSGRFKLLFKLMRACRR